MDEQGNWTYLKIGVILGAEIGTLIVDNAYCLRIEATPIVMALVPRLDICPVYVAPSQDSGRAWFQFPYTDELDAGLKALVDILGAIVYRQPQFAQIELFAEESVDG